VADERRAVQVLTALTATLVLALLILLLFEPEVQTLDAAELRERRDEARAFFAADYVFVVVYAVLAPLALWRFGQTLTRHGRTIALLAAALLAAAGVVDAVENALLLAASGSGSQATVNTAHGLAAPKVLLFVAGAALALATNWRALRIVRRS
jgi:hypothetical protein